MKNCTDCGFAEWKRLDNGKLDPSGEGECLRRIKIPNLPVCQYFEGGPPVIVVQPINRNVDHDRHCSYYVYTFRL